MPNMDSCLSDFYLQHQNDGDQQPEGAPITGSGGEAVVEEMQCSLNRTYVIYPSGSSREPEGTTIGWMGAGPYKVFTSTVL